MGNNRSTYALINDRRRYRDGFDKTIECGLPDKIGNVFGVCGIGLAVYQTWSYFDTTDVFEDFAISITLLFSTACGVLAWTTYLICYLLEQAFGWELNAFATFVLTSHRSIPSLIFFVLTTFVLSPHEANGNSKSITLPFGVNITFLIVSVVMCAHSCRTMMLVHGHKDWMFLLSAVPAAYLDVVFWPLLILASKNGILSSVVWTGLFAGFRLLGVLVCAYGSRKTNGFAKIFVPLSKSWAPITVSQLSFLSSHKDHDGLATSYLGDICEPASFVGFIWTLITNTVLGIVCFVSENSTPVSSCLASGSIFFCYMYCVIFVAFIRDW